MLCQMVRAETLPGYIEAFGDKSLLLPYDIDVIADHQALCLCQRHHQGADDHSSKGVDGLDRHGDTAPPARSHGSHPARI